jgi:hypothetical protein
MQADFLTRQSGFVIFVALQLALFGAVWFGWRLGQRDRKDSDENELSQVRGLQGAMLGLLALLLGFTFSMAAQRFDARRAIIDNEANAIGTAYLRTDLAAEPQRQALKKLLTRYVDARIDFYGAGTDEARQRAIDEASEHLHAELWQNAVAIAERTPGPTTALLVASLNDVIDLHGLRVASLRNHVPEVILWLLLVVAVLSAGLSGYAAGFGRRPGWIPTGTVLLIITLVIVVIIDVDQPRVGFIQTGQDSMLDLQKSLRSSGVSGSLSN